MNISFNKYCPSEQNFEKVALSHLDSLYYAALKIAGHQQDAEDLGPGNLFQGFQPP